MDGMKICREAILSAPNCTMRLGDPVFARRYPGDHEVRGRIVGRTFGKPIYDVETVDGERLMGLTLVRLDEEAMRAMVRAEAMTGGETK